MRKSCVRRICCDLVLAMSVAAVAAAGRAHAADDTPPTRPAFSNNTDTTEYGIVEVDGGFSTAVPAMGGGFQSAGGSIHIGLTDNLDLRIATDSWDRSMSRYLVATGVGDTYLNPRIRFNSERGHFPSFGIAYIYKAPSAARGLGSGKTDHVLSFLASKSLGRFHTDFNASVLFLGAAGHCADRAASWSADISHPLGNNWSVALDTYAVTSLDAENTYGVSQMLAVIYAATPRLYLDAAYDLRLTPGMNRARFQFGFTYSVGRLFGSRRQAAKSESQKNTVARTSRQSTISN